MIIAGAGLAGLIAAHAWPQATVVEAADGPRETHKALLRFRSDKVSQLTGIPFREVTVRKGIYFHGEHVAPSIQMSNLYSRKVLGGDVRERSICNLKDERRWIAPENFYEQLLAGVEGRIQFNSPLDEQAVVASKATGTPIISTIPLPVALDVVGLDCDFEFKRAPITAQRYRVPGADVFQTIYFPEPTWPTVYRASITGDILIVEHNSVELSATELDYVCRAFGLYGKELEPLGGAKQDFGKIVSMPDHLRKPLLFDLTHKHGIFSLGRFATYRNVMLDDVVDDLAAIRRMLHATSYEMFKEMTA